MSAPTVAVEWLLARAAVRATGLLHVVSRRDSGALNPVCGANPIRSERIETHARLDDVATLCPGCGTMAASIGGSVVDGVALLLGLSEAVATVRLLDVPTGAVRAHREHARRSPGADVDQLVASVQERGIVAPLVVRRVGQGFEVVDGARRLYAAHVAGLATVPAIVRDSSDQDALLDGLTANLHREDLNPIEQADAFRRALEQLQVPIERLADLLGLSRSHVSNTLRLLGLPPHLQEQVATGVLSAAHGRALLRITDPAEQDALADRIRDEHLSTRDADAAVRRIAVQQPADPQLAAIADLLTAALAAKIAVRTRGDQTEIVLRVPTAERGRVLEQLGVQALAA